MKEVDMSKFCVFILSHGRPDKNDTFSKLRQCGYSGKIIIVIDDEDDKMEQYLLNYGSENVYVFNKRFVANNVDSCNNFNDRRSPLFVRNAIWDIAKELRYKYFVQMDDDYYYFGHRGELGAKQTKNLDLVFKYFVQFLVNTNVLAIAFSQGGDHIGGFKQDVAIKRKTMNSWFCVTNREFPFVGLMNDDVNTYVLNGMRGGLFFTYMPFQLDQADTQQNSGGITELYLDSGTYVKSFYTVMVAPSCTTIKQMGGSFKRLHHSIEWKRCTPCIVRQEYKK